MTATATHTEDVVTIRRATPADDEGLARLAQLDSALPLAEHDVLVGELDGELLAALPVGAGRAIATPFRRTAGIVTLLEARRAELEVDRERPRRRFWQVLKPSPVEG